MTTYNVRAKVDQIVTKEIQLLVVASSEDEAVSKTREALEVYPQPVTVPGVRRVVTDKARYWIPRDIEIVEIEEDKEVA